MSEQHPATTPEIKIILKNLSMQDFKDFGLQQIAYIRAVQENDSTTYSIHSADGQNISVMDTLNQAIIHTREKHLEPVTVH